MTLFIRQIVASMQDLADHVRQNMPRSAPTHLPTRSTKEAYEIGYRVACDDIASLIESVEIEGAPTKASK